MQLLWQNGGETVFEQLSPLTRKKLELRCSVFGNIY